MAEKKLYEVVYLVGPGLKYERMLVGATDSTEAMEIARADGKDAKSAQTFVYDES